VLPLAPARLAQPPATTPGARARGAREQGSARAPPHGGPGEPRPMRRRANPAHAVPFPSKPSAISPEIHGALGVSLTA